MRRPTYSPALMDEDSLPGALSGPPPRPISPATFDQAHGVTAQSELVWRLADQAYGEDYPAEVRPWGMTTFWVLGRCVSGLRVGPGHLLVDLACGRGGPGLWLARATGASLIGVDWSPVGVEAARARASHFVPADRASFIVGDLAASGLPDASADAILCLDSIFFAADRIAALREVHRLLRPAGRYVFTAPEERTPTQPFHVPDWRALARSRRTPARKQGGGATPSRTAGTHVPALARTHRCDPRRGWRCVGRPARGRGAQGWPDVEEPRPTAHRCASPELKSGARDLNPGPHGPEPCVVRLGAGPCLVRRTGAYRQQAVCALAKGQFSASGPARYINRRTRARTVFKLTVTEPRTYIRRRARVHLKRFRKPLAVRRPV